MLLKALNAVDVPLLGLFQLPKCQPFLSETNPQVLLLVSNCVEGVISLDQLPLKPVSLFQLLDKKIYDEAVVTAQETVLELREPAVVLGGAGFRVFGEGGFLRSPQGQHN